LLLISVFIDFNEEFGNIMSLLNNTLLFLLIVFQSLFIVIFPEIVEGEDYKTFRCAADDFRYNIGTDGDECVIYVRNETDIPWADFNGYAYTCYQKAKNAGYKTGNEPKKSSIVVFDKQDGIGNAGHVGIVKSVDGSNITIRDSNYVGYHAIGEHKINTDNYIILGYIYCDDDGGNPDLRVSELTINKLDGDSAQPLALNPGEQFQITVEITNKGDGDVNDKFYIKYLISDDKVFDSHDEGISDETGDDDDSIPSLGADDPPDEEEIIVNAPDDP